MQIIFNPIKGYLKEPDWLTKVKQKIDNDTQLIEIYLTEFYIEEIKSSAKIYEHARCDVFYEMTFNNEKLNMDTVEFNLTFRKLRNILLLNWDRLKYTIGADFSICKRQHQNSYRMLINTQLLNLDHIQLNNVFGMTS